MTVVMIILMYVVIGALFGVAQLKKFKQLVSKESIVGKKLYSIIWLGVIVWIVAWPVFVTMSIYSKQLA